MDAETHELIAGYALDALDPADRARAEELLTQSEEAREELRSYGDVSTALAVAATGPAPSADLRGRILAAARAEQQTVVSLDERRRSRGVPVLGAVAAVAAAAAVALGIWGAVNANDLDDARTALERERATSALLADPDAQTVALESGSGRLVVGEGGDAVLVLDELGAAPRARYRRGRAARARCRRRRPRGAGARCPGRSGRRRARPAPSAVAARPCRAQRGRAGGSRARSSARASRRPRGCRPGPPS